MPPTGKPSVRGEYIETETGNKISRRATVIGPKHIVLAGKCVVQPDVVIHGDLVRPASTSKSSNTDTTSKDAIKEDNRASVQLGRYVFLSQGVTLHPPSRMQPYPALPEATQHMIHYPLRILDYVFIGQNTHVRAAEIRSNVWIGKDCTIGNMVMIKDNVKVLDGTVLPAYTTWPSGYVVAGRPGRVVGEIGEGWGAGAAGGGSALDEGVGVRSRERYAMVGNKR